MGTAPEITVTPIAMDTGKRRAAESRLAHGFKSINVPLLHLTCCAVISFTIAYVLDGYLAVPAESPRYVDDGKFKLKVSDVTTLVPPH